VKAGGRFPTGSNGENLDHLFFDCIDINEKYYTDFDEMGNFKGEYAKDYVPVE
jgi:hypothetical protein